MGVALALIPGLLNEWFGYGLAAQALRRDLESSQLEQSQIIAHSIHAEIERGEWPAAYATLQAIAGHIPGTSLFLTDSHGVERQTLQSIIAPSDLQAATSGLKLTHWLTPDHSLRVFVPLMNSRGELLAVLVNDTDQSDRFAQMYQEKAQRTFFYVFFLAALLTVFLVVSWRLFIGPLKNIYKLSRAITMGINVARAPDVPILELQQVHQAFNEMVDTLAEQQSKLEQTVLERTRALEDSYAEIRAHNRLMNELIAHSEQLNCSTTLKDLLCVIGEGALTLSKADRLALFFPSKRGPECRWSHGLSPQVIEATQAFIRQENLFACILNSGPLVVKDIQEDANRPSLKEVFQAGSFRGISAWPLIFQEKAIAFVCCFYDTSFTLQHPGIEVLEAFFRQASVSLENIRLFEAECAQRRLADSMREISSTLNSSLDLNEVLDGIVHSLGRVVPHDAAGIMLLEGETVRPARWKGIPAESAGVFNAWSYSIRDLYNRRKMIETVQALVIPDTQQDPHWVWTRGLEWVRSYAGAPIFQHGEVTGFIDVMSSRANFFDPDVAPILQSFAAQAAVAMENARLYQHTHQRMAETSALFRAVQPLFHPTNDILALSKQIAQSVTEEFASAHCSILLLNEARTHLVLAAQSGSLKLSTGDLSLNGPGLTVRAVHMRRPIYAPDVRVDAYYVAGAEQSRCELAIPLFASGEVIGVLNLESTKVDAFDERAQRLMASFAERAALGLENARLFETIRQNAEEMARLGKIAERRAQEAETLRLAAASVNSTLELQTVLDRILRHLDQVIPHDSACIFLIENEDSLRIGAVKSLAQGEEVLHQFFPRNDALLMEIEQNNRPVVLRNAQSDPRFHGWGGSSGVQSWMGIPLVAGKEFVGALTLDRYSNRDFLAEEIELAKAFANQAAVAVQNARLYNAAQQRARELEALHSATSTLVSTLDLQKLLEGILAAASRAIPMTETALLHLLGEDGCLSLRVRQGECAALDQNANLNGERSPWQWALQNHQPLLISTAAALPNDLQVFIRPQENCDQSIMIVPLILESASLGVITLTSSKSSAFSEQELTLLNSFANTATAAMRNAQLHSAVQHLAVTDPLTGIYNRRGFYDLARRVLEQAQMFGRPIAAIMFDIDFFKRVNDTYGHDAGDAVLREMAARCRKTLRDADLMCRYGGEEFAILLPESDIAGAMNAANRILRVITDQPITTPAGHVSITVSIGIAQFCKSCETLDNLLKCADLALYTAKQQGRNRVCVWNR